MGLCASTEDSARVSRALDTQMRREGECDEDRVKLLLLGAGESGKSTIFKQMRVLYGEGFGEADRKGSASVIISNLLDGTQTILTNMPVLDLAFTDPASLEAVKVLEETRNERSLLTEKTAAAVSTLWNDPEFQKAFEQRSTYQLFDSYQDFAKKAGSFPEWGGKDWIPSVSDVMKARVRTSGIVEERFSVDGIELFMFDVGGQRNERKKWIHCFENVNCIIFVGAISEYDQVLYEDATQNRLVEAVVLFEEIVNSRWFTSTSVILFLNKRDLFEEKYMIKKVPLDITGLSLFETAPKGFNLELAFTWLTDLFLTKVSADKAVTAHITCATDKTNISTVMDALMVDIISSGDANAF